MNVLITRPKNSAHSLAKALQLAGIESICFPSMSIENLPQPPKFQTLIKQSDITLFVSAHAVAAFLSFADHTSLNDKIVFAIGAGTANALKAANITVTDFPAIANSENLLALPGLQQVANQQIVILAGENGRTVLQETLSERGANVHVCFLYRRLLPDYPLPLPWHPNEVDISIVTSGQGLAFFQQLIEKYALQALYRKPLVVITEKMQDQARQLGFKSAIIQAQGASHAEILSALQGVK